MKKHLRMIAGIILHPVRVLVANINRDTYQKIINRSIAFRQHWKDHERMHNMSDVTGTAYTKSEIYARLMEETALY